MENTARERKGRDLCYGSDGNMRKRQIKKLMKANKYASCCGKGGKEIRQKSYHHIKFSENLLLGIKKVKKKKKSVRSLKKKAKKII